MAAPVLTGSTPLKTTWMSVFILHRPPLRSTQIYSWPSSCSQIQNKNKEYKRSKLDVRTTAKSGGGGGDEVIKSAKAKYKGTLMREKQLTEMIEKMVMEAKEVCQGDESSDECRVAWDEVEEVSQAKADLRLKLELQQDPLESFCHDHPETEECRIYED